MPAAEVPAEEALQGAEVPEEGAAGEGGADLVSMQVRAADTVTIRPRYGHDTVTIQVGYTLRSRYVAIHVSDTLTIHSDTITDTRCDADVATLKIQALIRPDTVPDTLTIHM